jgi:toxin CptA
MTEILRISPARSRGLAGFVVGSHLLTLAVPLLLPLSFLAQAALSLLVCFSLWHYWHAHVVGDHGRSIKTAEWDGGDDWVLFTAQGEKSLASLLGSSYVQPWLVVLNFSSERFGRCRLVILPDAMDADLLRRLRVRLRNIRFDTGNSI